MKSFKAKSGFTLMELMVYIGLLGFIVVIAGQAFSDSSRWRIRTQGMLQASQTAGNVATLIKQDIAQTGAKSFNKAKTSQFVLIDSVYMDSQNTIDSLKDSSSFNIKKGSGSQQDTIVMRRLSYSDSGDYQAVEQVTWFVKGDTLMRLWKSCPACSSSTVGAAVWGTDDTVRIADGVSKFKLTSAKPSIADSAVYVIPSSSSSEHNFKLVPRFEDENFEYFNVNPEEGGSSIRLSGFFINYDFSEGSTGPDTNHTHIKVNQVFYSEIIGNDLSAWSSQCKKITLEPYIEYEISFSMPDATTDVTNPDPSKMFCPGRDHMAVGFRYASNGAKPDSFPDFQFYPPSIGNDKDTGIRKMRFTTNKFIQNVCLGFTFAFFSPVASSGNIILENVKLKKIPSSNYKFTNETIAVADRKNVKAIKMELSIKNNGETGEETAIISIPSNGPKD